MQEFISAGTCDAVGAWLAKLHPAGPSLRKALETQRGKVKPEALMPLDRAVCERYAQSRMVTNADEGTTSNDLPSSLTGLRVRI